MKKFIENNSFSLVVGMFEKYGSTEKVAINFCNKLYDCKHLSDTHKIISNYNHRTDSRALVSAIAYLSIFEEKCAYLYKVLDNEVVWNWMFLFYWYNYDHSFKCSLGKIKYEDCDDENKVVESDVKLWYSNEKSFNCLLDEIGYEDCDDKYQIIEKGIGKLLECGELVISPDLFESSIFHICMNPNKELVDTSKAFEIYNSTYGETALFGAVERNEISLEEASRVIGAEIVEGNLDLMRVC